MVLCMPQDLRMPVGDDQTLSFLLLQPRNSRKKYPTILVRNPYGRLTFFYFFYLFAEVRAQRGHSSEVVGQLLT